MAIMFSKKAVFSDSFRDFVKSQKYEEYVYMIISNSERVFSGKQFKYIQNQSNGEPDFVDQEGNKYEAKLMFDERQGQLLGEHKYDITKWFESIKEEVVECSENIIRNGNTEFIKNTKLYRIFRKRLSSVNEDESAIFFIPYPIVNDVRGSVYLQFAADILQIAYNSIREEGLLGDKKIYFIYPSMEPSIYVLRDGDYQREYIECKELDPLIIYESTHGRLS